jgi:hypothetical protein
MIEARYGHTEPFLSQLERWSGDRMRGRNGEKHPAKLIDAVWDQYFTNALLINRQAIACGYL